MSIEYLSPRHWGDALKELALRSFEQTKPNIAAIGWVGFIGFPLYYLIWHDLVPQPYENLQLRLIGSFICLGAALHNHWPRGLRGLLLPYWYLGLLYCLPVFFNLLLIRNDFSTIWLLSTLIAAFLLVMLVDWVSALVLFGAGVGIAAGLAGVSGHASGDLLERYSQYLPIFLFALIAGSIFNYKSELLRRERRNAANEYGRSLALELRPPLNSMRAGMVGVAKFLPDLIRAYQLARNSNLPVPTIERRELMALEGAVERIRTEAEHVNTLFDMLSVGTQTVSVDNSTFSIRSMADCVDLALQSYPFRNERDRQRVVWKRDGDFSFLGNETLMVRVLMMLTKNCLYSIARAGKGEITVRVGTGAEENYLYIRETGFGIPAAQVAGLFENSSKYVDPTIASSGGLAFCKQVVEAFSGEIYCRSEVGRFTEFHIRLPAANRPSLRAVPRIVA